MARFKKHSILAKRPRSDGQNGPRQPECCTAPAQKIWWCYCRPDCLAQNASLQVQQHNSKPSFLTAVVTAACVARRPPTNQPTNQPTRQVTLSFNSPYKRANFRDDFLVYDHTTGKTPVLVRSPKLRASLCKILISSFAHKMDFANNFSVDFF